MLGGYGSEYRLSDARHGHAGILREVEACQVAQRYASGYLSKLVNRDSL
jgi:hypothetical protein